MQIFCILPIHVYQAPGANTSGASFTNSYLTAFLATGARLFRTIISHKIVTNLVKVPHIFAYVGFFLYLCARIIVLKRNEIDRHHKHVLAFTAEVIRRERRVLCYP